ncbi:MAG: hypothetical protein U0237_17130 [Thermoleophilia bacterium]
MTMGVPGRIAVATALVGVSAALAVAAAEDGSAPHSRQATAHATGQTVGVIVSPDREGAARVSITGGTAVQRRLVRDVIARVGAPPRIRSVSVTGGTATVTLARGSVSADPYWPAEVMAREVMFRSSRSGSGITLVRLMYSGFPTKVDRTFTPRAGMPPAKVLSDVRRRAHAAGILVRALRVYPIQSGAFEITAGMTARQMLEDGEARTSRAISPPEDRVGSWTMRLLAPNGVEVFRGGTAYHYGFAAPADLAHAASPPLPADITGPTRLTVQFSWVLPFLGRPATTTAVLDCEGTSTHVTAPAEACTRLGEDWLRYLPPLEAVCSGPLTNNVQITGTFRGIPMERSSQGCSGVDLTRWQQLLGIATPS